MSSTPSNPTNTLSQPYATMHATSYANSNISSFTGSLSFASPATTHVALTIRDGVIDLSGFVASPMVIRTRDGDINLGHLAAMMAKLDRLLCVVEESIKLNPENETLMSAYEQFRMVEELTK